MDSVSDTKVFEKEAENAIISNIRQLNNAVSINDAVFRNIVLSSVEYSLITLSFSKTIIETDKTALDERAARFINSILAVVGFNHKHLDTFLLILHNEGGITGIEIARMIAKDYGGHDRLPKYREAAGSPSTQCVQENNESICSEANTVISNQLTSIDDLLNPPYNLSMECLRWKFNDDLLVVLAFEGRKVEDVAHYFGMEDYLSQIKSESGKIMSIISKWKKIKENDATYFAIFEILIQNGCPEVVSIALSFKRKYCTSSQSIVDKCPFRPELSYTNWNELTEKRKEEIINGLKFEKNEVIKF
jgi:hypothetical protein